MHNAERNMYIIIKIQRTPLVTGWVLLKKRTNIMTQIIDDLQLFSKFRLKSDGVLLGCLHGLGQDCLLVPCVTSHFQDLR